MTLLVAVLKTNKDKMQEVYLLYPVLEQRGKWNQSSPTEVHELAVVGMRGRFDCLGCRISSDDGHLLHVRGGRRLARLRRRRALELVLYVCK